ncbi:hypothetical protein Patl1_33559 [Pistacia atlantica]|uniref:Uncharacterized protein n=1 Tax=Pistacia atlantica TaxID=434234 RepID=A0ACC0ZPC6_9ROSI|nr:hypothetical protein Patl1_33559 [Pistacia atlantica]
MDHFSASNDCYPLVKNILLLDSKGKRVAVKYFSNDWPTNGAKLAFEKNVFIKTLKTNARMEGYLSEIAMFQNNIVVYKFVQDLHFFVTGDASVIAGKVAIHSMDGGGSPLAEQTLSQALAIAREHITRTLLR